MTIQIVEAVYEQGTFRLIQLPSVMRRQPKAVTQADTYLTIHGRFTFSLITRYEVLRGLYAKQVTAQLMHFERLCGISNILALDDAVAVRAIVIYAHLHQRGQLTWRCRYSDCCNNS